MIESEDIWAAALSTLESGQTFALATVINVRGSTPREVGAKMVVHAGGQIGTIGGGCGEAEVFRKAQVLLQDGIPSRLTEVDLTGDFDQQEIGTCGGIMDVFIDRWSPGPDVETARKLLAGARQGRPLALLTVVDPGKKTDIISGDRVVIDATDPHPSPIIGLSPCALERIAERAAEASPSLIEIAEDGTPREVLRVDVGSAERLFLDPVAGAQRLVIVGAGHIAQPLCAIGRMLGFQVTVIDDRASFANRERFPDADRIIVQRFAEAIDSLHLDRHCYLVSVTRGHAFDETVVERALRQHPAFVGMIGSRRRVKATLERIGEKGIDNHRLAEVHAPIGLDIGAETPAEIAVSIVSEIIRERRTGVRDEYVLGVKLGRLRRMT